MSSRNASSSSSAATPGSAKGPNWPNHLRQFSKQSHDRAHDSTYPSSPGDTASSNSTLRDRPSSRLSSRIRAERRWTVTVNESFARDEVLLNLDQIGDDVQPGSLVVIDVVKADSEKATQNSHHHKPAQDRKEGAAGNCAEKRYICVAKDMPRELKARYSAVEVYVAKHIADAFGMRKGTQVTLTPVCEVNPLF